MDTLKNKTLISKILSKTKISNIIFYKNSTSLRNKMLTNNRHLHRMVNAVQVKLHDEINFFMEVCVNFSKLFCKCIRIIGILYRNLNQLT